MSYNLANNIFLHELLGILCYVNLGGRGDAVIVAVEAVVVTAVKVVVYTVTAATLVRR